MHFPSMNLLNMAKIERKDNNMFFYKASDMGNNKSLVSVVLYIFVFLLSMVKM